VIEAIVTPVVCVVIGYVFGVWHTRRAVREALAKHTGSAPNLYVVARDVTDEVLGEGTYAKVNATNPDPAVQAVIRRARDSRR
jgi:hypothetical protein